ncbi:extensin [Altererythrobacter indicus]|uniref:Extensin n=1 Tax=Altericroceibacterium indicum TaxID=374177 RepID=A0A845A4E5_9SPHN|nr:extensin family protein [Altericroceibacterium indicum]MXP25070.1 extensin [Altericroceibacterium indicum]
MKLAEFLKSPKVDLAAVFLLMALGVFLLLRVWLQDHPQHNPWVPLDLRDPPGWTTRQKLADLRVNSDACRTILERSGIGFVSYEPVGEGACRRDDRLSLTRAPLSPSLPQTSCAVAAGFAMWFAQSVEPAARKILGSGIARIEHLGSYNCRRINSGKSGSWSEHATGNAIDITGFTLEDGRRISVLKDWQSGDEKGLFLRAVRDGACGVFGTVLSPDYNVAHADHFHLDQQKRTWGVCR